ncbi:hypothetical protein A946_09900 [Methylacidiphilum kamchatkense Kam1]|uniref:Uncharacterized protein n=1 Tax=Methylacidiphilum kamchatkense Kam1 TaxID=1202785 RepID=A0A0C1RSN9_9BACT|nr:hypothetical protein [Methylacidiphilum kamchatkense]KIE57956.1 hypothetical protein A946_09900 [Methylacidiphilum kamchatkense Kam1]QDQ42387.1 hypothetical protein kam1_1159 [Methylacidiphilum kamchatkense Kam1]
MDTIYPLLIYGLLLYFFRTPPLNPFPLHFPWNFSYTFIFLPIWLHSLLKQNFKNKNLLAFLWIALFASLNKFSFLFPYYSFSYSLESFGYILSNASLFFYIIYIGLAWAQRLASEKAVAVEEEKKESIHSFFELLVILKNDPGFLVIPGVSHRSIRSIARNIYIIPKEALQFISKDNLETWCPWHEELKVVENFILEQQNEIQNLKSCLLEYSESKDKAEKKVEELQNLCFEMEKSRDQLLKDIHKMRSESRLNQVSDLYRLSNEELAKTKENRIREIKIIDQILSVRVGNYSPNDEQNE